MLIRTGPAADPMIFADAVQRSRSYTVAGVVTVVDATTRSPKFAITEASGTGVSPCPKEKKADERQEERLLRVKSLRSCPT